jgi:hypothetical protein
MQFNEGARKEVVGRIWSWVGTRAQEFPELELAACEGEVIKLLNYNLKLDTPFDYLLPTKEKKLFALIESVIDFSITMT